MIEIIITIVIFLFAGSVIFKSIKNSSKGKCSCGSCKNCSQHCNTQHTDKTKEKVH